MPADPLHPIHLHDAGDGPGIEADEVDVVLRALDGLLRSTGSPVVRACLEEARDDIAHLTNRDENAAPDAEERAAA
jgi:hypothetical protein